MFFSSHYYGDIALESYFLNSDGCCYSSCWWWSENNCGNNSCDDPNSYIFLEQAHIVVKLCLSAKSTGLSTATQDGELCSKAPCEDVNGEDPIRLLQKLFPSFSWRHLRIGMQESDEQTSIRYVYRRIMDTVGFHLNRSRAPEERSSWDVTE